MAQRDDARGDDTWREIRWQLTDWDAHSNDPCDEGYGCGRWMFCARCDGSWDGAGWVPDARAVVGLAHRFGGDPTRYADEVVRRGLLDRAIPFLADDEPIVYEGHEVSGEVIASATAAAQWELIRRLLTGQVAAQGLRPHVLARACELALAVAPDPGDALDLLSAHSDNPDEHVAFAVTRAYCLHAPDTPGLARRLLRAAASGAAFNHARWVAARTPQPPHYEYHDADELVIHLFRQLGEIAVPWPAVGDLMQTVQGFTHPHEILGAVAGWPTTPATLHVLSVLAGSTYDWVAAEREEVGGEAAAALATAAARLATAPPPAGLTEEDAFLLALWQQPAERTLLFAYADWLEEHDAPDRAAALRAAGHYTASLANLPDEPTSPAWSAWLDAAAKITDPHWLAFVERIINTAERGSVVPPPA